MNSGMVSTATGMVDVSMSGQWGRDGGARRRQRVAATGSRGGRAAAAQARAARCGVLYVFTLCEREKACNRVR